MVCHALMQLALFFIDVEREIAETELLSKPLCCSELCFGTVGCGEE